jgi:peptidoglycan-associated lipoprotein
MRRIFEFTLVAGIFLLASLSANAQPLSEPTYEMKLEYAYELYAEKDYYNALDMFQECYRDSRDVQLLPQLAKLNYLLRDYERAERWYDRYISKDEEKLYVEDRFYYARILRILGKEEESREMFLEFMELSDDEDLNHRAEVELLGMEVTRGVEQPEDLFITAISQNINSGLTDLSPAVGPDGKLYYATFNRSSRITYTEDEQPHFLRIYSAAPNEDDWAAGERMRHRINRENYHTGNVSISSDGRTMFFTRSQIQGEELIESEIFMSSYDGNDWGAPQRLEGVNGDWIATHPAPGELFGNQVLYFSSNMDGGRGGFDIYYATHQGGNRYSIPVNLGGVINTAGNEVTPHYIDGKLFFSSDGHPGMGGLDAFASTWDGTRWSDPVSKGPGINTPYDDFYLRLDENEKNGFMVSNRPYDRKRTSRSKSCCDDIFRVKVEDVKVNYLATVLDENNQPLLGSTIKLQEIRRGEVVNEISATNEDGNTFNVPLQPEKSYRIIIDRDEYHSDSIAVNTVGLEENTTFEREFFLLERDPVVEIISINEPIRLNNIYYDFDDDQILPEAEKDLDYLYELMIDYSNMVIELSAHTDARGNPSYNMSLSQRRANSAKEYLVNKGIDRNRIQAVGYGETKILNQCVPNVECTEEEHRLNRRTEFKILEGPTTIEIRKERIELRGDAPQGNLHLDADQNSVNWDWIRNLQSLASVELHPMPQSGLQSWTNIREIKLDSVPDGGASQSQQELKEVRYADIKFEKQFHDFGLIKKTDRPEHIFEFVNTGDVDLIIDFVTACECTELDWPTSPISPGERGQIKAVYDPTEREGEQEVTIDIIANTNPMVKSARFRVFIID